MHPLAPGTRVKAWRVKAYQGQGAYGAVYRAERVGWRRSEPGALKVSLWLWDARMKREVELLSRLSHPSIPRLLDRGGPWLPSRDEYPFFVMEWVQGPALYAWAEQQAPSGRQVCRVVAQVARALEAIHSAGAVHRDVKGDNVLVRLSDRRAVLIDFGSCHFQGAQRLTWQALPPVTLAYLSPQAWPVYLRSLHHADGSYAPSPADDLYALGVTAYRLVMGQYPAPFETKQDEQGTWQARGPDLRPQLEGNPRVEPLLREVIIRLLSDEPEARGTAAQIAQTLEAAAGEKQGPAASRPPERTRTWTPWLTLAAAAACAVWLWNSQWEPRPTGFSNAQAPDAGTAAVGDTSPTQPRAATPSSKENRPIAQQPLPQPRPGQARPDEKGQCLGLRQVPINGGCWVEQLPMSAEECAEIGYVLFQGKCFGPVFAPLKKPAPTSSPGESR
ncbi:MAG TPA: protein kinase [Myxococcaceae bacterium]|jgi:serine/threonine protein kinase